MSICTSLQLLMISYTYSMSDMVRHCYTSTTTNVMFHIRYVSSGCSSDLQIFEEFVFSNC
jgi:hypothetical protein